MCLIRNRVISFIIYKNRFIDTATWIQTFPSNASNYQSLKEEIHNIGVSNIRDCLFTVVPKLKCDFHHDYRKMKKRLEEINEYERRNKKKITKGNPAISLIEDKLEKLIPNVKNERERNEEILKSTKGQYVTFGSECHLQHVDSELFLSLSAENAKSNKIGYITKMTSWYSKNICMKIVPKYKSRRIGEAIQFEDEISIEGYRNDFF